MAIQSNIVLNRPVSGRSHRCIRNIFKQNLLDIFHCAQTLRYLLRHRDTPRTAKIVAGLSVAYLLSPIQLIPTFIPVIGQIDDLFVLYFGLKMARKLTPVAVFGECEAKSQLVSDVNWSILSLAKTYVAADQKSVTSDSSIRAETAL